MPRRLTPEEFIQKAREVHGDRYNYSDTKYRNSRTKVRIVCQEHGPFDQIPNAHISKAAGCPECGIAARGDSLRSTEAEFIRRAKEVHGDRYDYSRVEYLNNHTKVAIICPVHGPFEQVPSGHLRGDGCPDCGSNKLTTESFIEKAREVHGDRYDYSCVDYVSSRTNVVIVCPEHGPFEQTPNNHLSQKSGCMECGGRKQLTTDLFIEKARAIHGDRFDYSAVEYINNATKVTIICPDHGPFLQTPSNHTSRGRKVGCPDCAGRNVTTAKFIEKAVKIHGDRYDYSQADYRYARDIVKIICPVHGVFEQAATDHLAGKGCRYCAGNQPLILDAFLERARAIHGDRYDYSRVTLTGVDRKVKILCRDHGPFEQAPQQHLNAEQGCPSCAATGFTPGRPATLYYLAIATEDGDTRYKIGITNKTVNKRFLGEDFSRIRVVRTWRFAVGRFAAEREKEVLRNYAGDRYYGPPLLRSGNTELFTHDVLGLDDRPI